MNGAPIDQLQGRPPSSPPPNRRDLEERPGGQRCRGLRADQRFGNVQTLEGSFSVAPGRIVGFLGPNGGGKTSVALLPRGIWSRSWIGRAEEDSI
jgi:ABC-type glutathione transport system ATPase component